MKRFYCQCGQEIFFENAHCGACGTQLGYSPSDHQLFSVYQYKDSWFTYGAATQKYKFCEHRFNEVECNWLIADGCQQKQCLSCRLTRVIPTLSKADNGRKWAILEAAKRTMLYGVLTLNLPIVSRHDDATSGLVFDFMEDQTANPSVAEVNVYSGHANGVITMNAAEADDSYREGARHAMNETYRTLLGHFRHEIGHYYWQKLIQGTDNYDAFREAFGDEMSDYRAALDYYYANGAMEGWSELYISAYASSHPLEDWAETWAHYMHMYFTIEVAIEFNMLSTTSLKNNFDELISEWMTLVVTLNALNRSMGKSDAYPFVISDRARHKLQFVHDVIWRR